MGPEICDFSPIFGFRTSFGTRISAFGFNQRLLRPEHVIRHLVPGKGRGRTGRQENRVGGNRQDCQRGERPVTRRHRQGESPLPRHLGGRDCIRQFGQARPAGHLSARQCDQVLDGRLAADEGGWQEPADMSGRHRLRGTRITADHPARRNVDFRG